MNTPMPDGPRNAETTVDDATPALQAATDTNEPKPELKEPASTIPKPVA